MWFGAVGASFFYDARKMGRFIRPLHDVSRLFGRRRWGGVVGGEKRETQADKTQKWFYKNLPPSRLFGVTTILVLWQPSLSVAGRTGINDWLRGVRKSN